MLSPAVKTRACGYEYFGSMYMYAFIDKVIELLCYRIRLFTTFVEGRLIIVINIIILIYPDIVYNFVIFILVLHIKCFDLINVSIKKIFFLILLFLRIVI